MARTCGLNRTRCTAKRDKRCTLINIHSRNRTALQCSRKRQGEGPVCASDLQVNTRVGAKGLFDRQCQRIGCNVRGQTGGHKLRAIQANPQAEILSCWQGEALHRVSVGQCRDGFHSPETRFVGYRIAQVGVAVGVVAWIGERTHRHPHRAARRSRAKEGGCGVVGTTVGWTPAVNIDRQNCGQVARGWRDGDQSAVRTEGAVIPKVVNRDGGKTVAARLQGAGGDLPAHGRCQGCTARAACQSRRIGDRQAGTGCRQRTREHIAAVLVDHALCAHQRHSIQGCNHILGAGVEGQGGRLSGRLTGFAHADRVSAAGGTRKLDGIGWQGHALPHSPNNAVTSVIAGKQQNLGQGGRSPRDLHRLAIDHRSADGRHRGGLGHPHVDRARQRHGAG